jgi:hypothetical protein
MNASSVDRRFGPARVSDAPRRLGKDSLLAALLLAVFFVHSLLSVVHKTTTYDEPDHYRYGEQILQGNSNRFDDSKMPVSALNAAPAKIAEYVPAGALHFLLSKYITARAVTTLAACLLGALLFLWTKHLYGKTVALAALLMFVFEPNIIAHSTLVTTDLYAAFSAVLTVSLLWAYLKSRRPMLALAVGLALGLSLVAKYTNVLLLLIVPVLLGLVWLGKWSAREPENRGRSPRAAVTSRYAHAAVALGGCLLVINLGFLFNRTFTPLREYRFRSLPFTWLQQNAAALGALPVPVPYPYLEGLDWVIHLERTNFEGRGKYYLFGELSPQPFPGYYSIAFLFKVPLAIQAAFVAAAVEFWRRRNRASFFQKDVYVLAPLIVYTGYFNILNNSQLGIRYLLVAFPFYLIFAGKLVEDWDFKSIQQRLAGLGLSLWLIVSVLSYFPHYIPYFNELLIDRRLAYTILADSNLDWGQNGEYLDEYMESHPEAQVSPTGPTSGLVVVRANDLVGVTGSPNRYAWLRQCYRPVDTIGYSILVFRVGPEEELPPP